jgi:hypothetical protein
VHLQVEPILEQGANHRTGLSARDLSTSGDSIDVEAI